MKKIVVIMVITLIILGAITAVYVSMYGEPPVLQATIGENTYIAQRGSYSWNNMFEKVQADAPTPTQMEYNEQSTFALNIGDTIKITTDNHLKFYVSKLNYIDNNDKNNIVITNDSQKEELKETVLETITTPGTYTLEIKANFYKYGEVTYCFRINVNPDIRSYEVYNETDVMLMDKINEIVQKLPYSQYKETVQLQDDTLTLIYKCKELNKEDLEFNSVMLLGLIPSLNNINYQISNNEDIFQVDINRNMYQEFVDYEYLGLVRYVMLKGKSQQILDAWNTYIPYYTFASTANGKVEKNDAKILATIAIMNTKQRENIIGDGYPYKLLNTLNKEAYGVIEDLPKEDAGSFVYNSESDTFSYGTEMQTPRLLRPYNIIEEGSIITIEYQYCYPKDSDILKLKMDKIEENTYAINKEAYNIYILGLPKYNAKMVIEKNPKYEYIEYKLVSFEEK